MYNQKRLQLFKFCFFVCLLLFFFLFTESRVFGEKSSTSSLYKARFISERTLTRADAERTRTIRKEELFKCFFVFFLKVSLFFTELESYREKRHRIRNLKVNAALLRYIKMQVLQVNARRETGRKAQMQNISAAKAVSDVVRTTLGPRSMLKMILDAS